MGGAYLSRPVKEKISDDKSNARLSYGVSSMQGWREKQEDAHNCIIEFDEKTSLFGVYDGHGGFEVAKYTAEKLPDYIRNTKKYQECSYKEALIEAFLGFDDTIATPDVMNVLKEMVDAEKERKKKADAEKEKKKTDADNSEDSDESISENNEESSSAIPEKSVEENSTPQKCSKGEQLSNEPCGDGLVNSTVSSLNDDITEESIPEAPCEQTTNESSNSCRNNIPSTAPDRGPGIDSGCTAVVALIRENNLYVANAGDCRCIICKAGLAVDMSEDHKPKDDAERDRIVKAGGRVSDDGRVNGDLNLSRAIGDHRFKKNEELPNTEQIITALPDVRVIELEPEVEFIVLACDGIWNSMTSQEVVDFIRPKIQANQKLSSICEELFEKCFSPHSPYWDDRKGCDNMTCIIVKPLHGDEASSNAAAKSDAETHVPKGATDIPSVADNKSVSEDIGNTPSDKPIETESKQSDKSETTTASLTGRVTSTPAKAQKRAAEESVEDL